jgi:hypothetical protein
MRRSATIRTLLAISLAVALGGRVAAAQPVLFDFDGANVGSPLPLDQTVGAVTAHLSSTGAGYSIQSACAGVTPTGFAGHWLCPSSIYLADLTIDFSEPMKEFSILGCGSTATMRATGYLATSWVATNTTAAAEPGTWPSATLTLAAAGFDRVVVHYDAAPPFDCDYGTIFMADNLSVTPVAESIFADGFDLGDWLAWSSALP